MKKIKCILIAVLSLTGMAQATEGTWFDKKILTDPDRPYHYYPDEKQVKQEQSSLPQTGAQAQVMLEQLQESVKLSRALALFNPTEANLKDYIQKNEQVLNISSNFTDVWRRVLWKNPELDYSQNHRPTNATAIRVFDQVKRSENEQKLAMFGQNYGLVFFVRSDCQYCHAIAPTIKRLQQNYGVRVMTVSLDGKGIPGYENILPDNGISQRLKVETTPALFVADTFNKQYVPLGFGVMSDTELEERIVALMTPVGTAF